jgi:hypothetical protein
MRAKVRGWKCTMIGTTMKCLQASLGAPVALKEPAEYRQHASECQKLARSARTAQERQLLLQIAERWERTAVDRERKAAAQAARSEFELTHCPC